MIIDIRTGTMTACVMSETAVQTHQKHAESTFTIKAKEMFVEDRKRENRLFFADTIAGRWHRGS